LFVLAQSHSLNNKQKKKKREKNMSMDGKIETWNFDRKDNCVFLECELMKQARQSHESEIYDTMKNMSSERNKGNSKNIATLKYVILLLLLILSLFSTVKSLCDKHEGEIILPVAINENYTLINETIRLYN
jgi:hypothetical protein